MHLARGIRTLGFRKWYERELLQSHGHLLLTLLCTLGLLGAVEAAMSFTGWQDRLIDAVAALASAAIGLWSLRRYLYLLSHAEFVANQADCPQCGTYARFTLVGEPAEGRPAPVCCRQCQHRWAIDS